MSKATTVIDNSRLPHISQEEYEFMLSQHSDNKKAIRSLHNTYQNGGCKDSNIRIRLKYRLYAEMTANLSWIFGGILPVDPLEITPNYVTDEDILELIDLYIHHDE